MLNFEDDLYIKIPLFLLFVSFLCLVVGILLGRERGKKYPERWRRRARYLRWLSMSCLSAMALLVALVLLIQRDSTADQQTTAVGSLLVLGLLAAVLASVYRYIERLSYFYDSRADAASLVIKVSEDVVQKDAERQVDTLTSEQIKGFVVLSGVIGPDKLEYPEAVQALAKIKKMSSS